ncbi:SMP-30/gluconolactonase/LRE family protein [Cupriavidus sp. D39]|uniref:SMP-30/gluconolactonase/LRE family protein n=1 Tax=Cupriavidus sp. D39 TaxID=2997877 RepID=UPI002270165B|nr:SMP-30/gluconolactonase/LRE family protein [Cupriavidus sp. D39]MCY0853461.1 SMP-30/gluconolactonase/LRE family protein [Cupriavidus sp. D39]
MRETHLHDYDAGEPRAQTSLHRVDRDGAISVAATGLEFPNGSVIVADGKTLIVAETWLGRLTAFDIDSQGELGNRRLYANLGAREPDGICADAAGAIWVACFNTGEFLRVLDGGAVTDIIEFDGRAISCTLGGADGRQLFCSVYRGTYDELSERKRKGAILTVNVDVPAPSECARCRPQHGPSNSHLNPDIFTRVARARAGHPATAATWGGGA